MLNIRVVGDQAIMAKLSGAPAAIRLKFYQTVTRLTLKLERKIKREKLSGQVLNVRTGALRASIHSVVEQNSSGATGKVSSSGDVKYAAIHEFGGKTPPHVIEAKGKALAFSIKGQQIFRKRVNHPGSQMPERSYMRSSLAEMKQEIVSALRAAAAEGAQPR